MKKYVISLGEEYLNLNCGFVRPFESDPTFFKSESEALQAIENSFAANFIDFVEIETIDIKL